MTAATARQLRAEDTRARLVAAAASLFAERGYEGTTVDAIARGAGVAKGTFFVHFATKDAVVAELVRHQVRAARERAQRAEGGPVERLREAVLGLGREAARSRELTRAVLAATLSSPPVAEEARALFDELGASMVADALEAKADGALLPSAEAETLASALMASYLGAALQFAAGPGGPPLLDVLARLVDAHLDAHLGARLEVHARGAIAAGAAEPGRGPAGGAAERSRGDAETNSPRAREGAPRGGRC